MKLSEVLSSILSFAKEQLNDEVLSYLRNTRKLSDSLIKEFEFGFIPHYVKFPLDKKWLKYHRLVCKDTKDRIRCPFEGRIVLPIHSARGEIVSLQSRVLDSRIDPTLENYNSRKYYHSSFNKSKVLFNLNRAIPFIRKSGKVIVTEGQFDVITAWKFGIKNCVGSTGTVLNFSQVGLLARYASEILIIFDNDKAGREASEKLKKKKFIGVKVKQVTLPSKGEKVDLDDFLHSNGKCALISLIKKNKNQG